MNIIKKYKLLANLGLEPFFLHNFIFLKISLRNFRIQDVKIQDNLHLTIQIDIASIHHKSSIIINPEYANIF